MSNKECALRGGVSELNKLIVPLFFSLYRFIDFREPDGSLSKFYWHLLTLKLAFVILFEVSISVYYIDTDEIPGFFLLLKNHIFIERSEDTIFISHV